MLGQVPAITRSWIGKRYHHGWIKIIIIGTQPSQTSPPAWHHRQPFLRTHLYPHTLNNAFNTQYGSHDPVIQSIWVYNVQINPGSTRLCPRQGPVQFWSVPDCNHFPLLVVWTSWAASEAVRQLVPADAHSCFAMASHERVLCTCLQLSWEIIVRVFIYVPQSFDPWM